jgi:hypothetical protein
MRIHEMLDYAYNNGAKRTHPPTKMSNTNNQENRNCPQPWVSVFKD